MTKPILLKDLGTMYPLPTSKIRRRFGIFKCFCGKEFKTQITKVKSGHTKSCGCYNASSLREQQTTHGDSSTRLYSIFLNMKTRCYNKRTKQYNGYGSRGITICDEWRYSYETFKEWAMDNGYNNNLTIDRKDNNGNYEPSNCRWTTTTIQARNTRKIQNNNTTGYRGVRKHKEREHKSFRAVICVNYKPIHLGLFDTALEAAKEYDKYVLDNHLEHTINGV